MKNMFRKHNIHSGASLRKRGLFSIFSYEHPFLRCVSLALILNFIVEILCRRSLVDGLLHIIKSPFVFLYNTLIILLTLIPALFFKHQAFYFYVFSVIWLALGITNFVLLGIRTTPLSFIDFQILLSALNIIGIYVSLPQLILIILAIVAAIFIAVLVFKRTISIRPRYGKALVMFSTTGIVFGLVTVFLFRINMLSMSFPSMANAYDDYGFAYCFSMSIIDRGIDEPDGYSEAVVQEITDKLPATTVADEDLPNIIFVQIESYFDPNRFSTYEYSEDPMPYWTYLRENYPGGLLTVPSIGAGTANTEFEVISGMNLDYFGVGEYPYKTIMKETTAETVNFNLKSLGYSTHAIHNHTYDFYDRHIVYENLGFDTFTPVEFMPDVERNFIDWAKDDIICVETMRALSSTAGRDLVYAITVQAHGKYPTDLTGYEYAVDYEYIGEGDDPLDHNQYVYLLNEMRASSEAIRKLLNELSAFEEKTVVVMFGDHFPAMEFSDTALKEGNLLETEYVIWSNYGLSGDSKDLSAFELNSHVLKSVGINTGYVNKLHQISESNDDYLRDLEILQYDMLYGEKYVYENRTVPYNKTDLQYGISDIEIIDAAIEDQILYVHGHNFTEYSRIKINDHIYDTVVESSSVLKLIETRNLPSLNNIINISVVQLADNGNILYESNAIKEDFRSSSLNRRGGGLLGFYY